MIPEGRRVEEVGEILEQAGVISKDTFLAALVKSQYDEPFLKQVSASSLEGFVFPAKYEFHRGAKAEEVVDTLLRGFQTNVADKVHQAIIAFQFYDKLVQRLAHVCHSQGELSGLVDNQEQLYNPQSWVRLQEQIRSKYTMAEECAMFDAVLAGATVQDALDQYMATRMKEVQDSGGEIELF